MKLLQQILSELGADLSASVTLVPGSCCYLKGVKTILSFSPELITLSAGKLTLSVGGEDMQVGGYFEGDLLIKGAVREVKVEKSDRN